MAVQLCSATLAGQPSEGEYTHLLPSCLPSCTEFVWTGFERGPGCYRGRFCEKLPETSPRSGKANTSQVQDELTTCQDQANQR